MSARRVCIVTGTRAEYGLLYWLMREVQDAPGLDLQIAVTGMHLSPEFGLTVQDIEADGFEIDERVEMLLSSDSPTGISKSVGLGVIGFADAFDRLDPDVVVVLGDRFEILAAAQSAMIARIPVAHLHGGETTEGAIDESIRHAITKLADLHFVAAAPFRQRVIQLGEQPTRVFNVGAPGLDYIQRLDLMSRDELEQSLDIAFGDPTLLVTYHPATRQDAASETAANELLTAIERILDQSPGGRVIFTKSNADTHGRVINKCLQAFVNTHPNRTHLYDSLGQRRYLSALHYVDVVVGNSSSGIIEAPAIPVPTVNVGPRQKGRPRADSVLDCPDDASAIFDAVTTALSDNFQSRLDDVASPYGTGEASSEICHHLQTADLTPSMKSFYDLPADRFDDA